VISSRCAIFRPATAEFRVKATYVDPISKVAH
jgi:hypothetical protein